MIDSILAAGRRLDEQAGASIGTFPEIPLEDAVLTAGMSRINLWIKIMVSGRKEPTVKDPADVLRENRVYAVVGATRNKEKYGYQIFRILNDYGYNAYAVNPNYESIEEFPCFPTLAALPEKPDVAVTVVPPDVTAGIIGEADRLGIRTVWMPPGSGSEAAVRKCEECGLAHVDEDCVILAVKFQGRRVS